jgi:hypothetical protein
MMSGHRRYYIYGAALLAFGIYQLAQRDPLESSLYFSAALTFAVNGAASEPALENHKKLLVIASWIFIAITALLFLYLLQFKYF